MRKCYSDIASLDAMPYAKIAQELLRTDGQHETFEVDFLDQETTARIKAELEKLGCKVESPGRSTKLRVTPPRESHGPN